MVFTVMTQTLPEVCAGKMKMLFPGAARGKALLFCYVCITANGPFRILILFFPFTFGFLASAAEELH
jgi:hypothetical protein